MTVYHVDPVELEVGGGKTFRVWWAEGGEPTIAWFNNYGELSTADLSDTQSAGSIVMRLAEHAMELKSDAAEEIEDLKTQLAASEALRVAAEQQYDQQFKAHGYWYRRACENEQSMRDALHDLEYGRPLDAVAGLARGLDKEGRADRPSFEQQQRDRRQSHILAWAVGTFTMPGCEPADIRERARRFLEEAVEMFQAVYLNGSADLSAGARLGSTWKCQNDIEMVFNRVLFRDPGEVQKELGQVAVTLACLAESLGLSVAAEEVREFERVLSIPKAEFQARHQAKMDAGL